MKKNVVTGKSQGRFRMSDASEDAQRRRVQIHGTEIIPRMLNMTPNLTAIAILLL